MSSALLTQAIAFNGRALNLNLEGISHGESLVQPAGGNCINWLVGHIVRHRNLMLETLGEAPVWSEEAQRRYDRGSDAIVADGAEVVHLDDLKREFDAAGERLKNALEGASEETLAANAGKSTVAQKLLFLAQHESYHVGQVALMRRVVGKAGAIH